MKKNFFEICKQDTKLLPLNVESEKALRVHLMMTFMATVVLKIIKVRLASSKLNAETAFMNLHELQIIDYDDELITIDPKNKLMMHIKHLVLSALLQLLETNYRCRLNKT